MKLVVHPSKAKCKNGKEFLITTKLGEQVDLCFRPPFYNVHKLRQRLLRHGTNERST